MGSVKKSIYGQAGSRISSPGDFPILLAVVQYLGLCRILSFLGQLTELHSLVLQEIKQSLGMDCADQNYENKLDSMTVRIMRIINETKHKSVHNLLASDCLLEGEVDIGELPALQPPPGHQLGQGRLVGGRGAVCSVQCAVCSVQ